MGGGNGSGAAGAAAAAAGEAWAVPPCDERVCSALPLRVLVPVTAVCAALFLVGAAGNALTVLVVRAERGGRSTTSLYVGSMAVSDLLLLLGLPLDLYRLWRSRPWIFGALLCRLSHFVAEGCTYCTALHIAALTAERYLAVCFPLKAKVVATKRRAKAVIAALWAVALLSAAPFLFLVGLEPPAAGNRSDLGHECKPTAAAQESGLLGAMFWVTTAYFVLPVVCLHVLYGFVGRRLWSSELQTRGPRASARQRGQRHTVRLLAVVVLAFVICWLPFHIGRIIFINTQDTKMMFFSQYFNIFAFQLFYLSASINPILYNLVSKKYRAAAYKLLLPHRSGQRAFTVTRDTGGCTETSASIRNEYITTF